MQLAFYFDQTRCTGCYACMVACKDWHEIDLGAEPASWRWIVEFESGKYPNPNVNYVAMSCFHCMHPPCIDACPASAIFKRTEDGVVLVDRQDCLGRDECGALCESVCPYEAPKFGDEPNPKMQKCDMCVDRWGKGQFPVCVTACPMRALDAGDLEELRRKYGDGQILSGFEYSVTTRPSIVANTHRQFVR